MSSLKRPTTSHEVHQDLAVDLANRNVDLPSFPHPFQEGEYGVGREPKTLVELNIMHLSGTIRSKANWSEKMRNESIRNKWKQEALEHGLLTEKQIDYVLAELEYYNSIRDGVMEMSSVDGVWQSDDLVPNDLKESLVARVAALENVPEHEKDWHPGTNQQILDLVHPSLFPFVNKVSRIINENNRQIGLEDAIDHIGDGAIVDITSATSPTRQVKYKRRLSTKYTRSNTYQWLPAEFDVSKTGQVKIVSYINNLHPVEHQNFYRLLESIFERFVPLFNKVLTDLVSPKPNRITVDPYQWYKESNDDHMDEDEDKDEDEDDDQDERNARTLIVPDVSEFAIPPPASETVDLRGRKLQVIVKLANIILTPTNSKYPGGVWHVEGMENEHIVASGIYYYSSSNLTQSDLQFRTVVCEPNYEQDDRRGVQTVYGLVNDGPLNQPLGAVITQENRCIAFPNIYQHRVAPFELKDPTRSGERKILVFFLVDPLQRILSTAHVPPQQAQWYHQAIRTIPPFDKLTPVVLDRILHYVDFPMTLNDAKEHREKLMNERKYFINQNNELLFERPFSLCEH